MILAGIAPADDICTLKLTHRCSDPDHLRNVIEHIFAQANYDPDEHLEDDFWAQVLDFTNYVGGKYTHIDLSDAGVLALLIVGDETAIRETMTVTDEV